MSPPPAEPDWYLKEWMTLLGKKQADLVRDRGWLKGRASKFWNGEHSYRRELVNEISAWLGIRPYELLMPPSEALRIRRLKEVLEGFQEEFGPTSEQLFKLEAAHKKDPTKT